MRLFNLVLFVLVLTVAGQPNVAGAAPPNVVIFLADDQGWGDLSVHGNTQLKTANIDSLARDGALFERFYVCPVCSPTRAEFLTGRYHLRGGVRGVSTGQERIDLDERTIAEAFQQAGYATGAFGKWHNGSQWPYHPNARGFDEYYGFTSGHWGEYFDPPLEHNGKFVRGKGYITDDLTNHAMEFIEKNKDGPFFCYLPYNIPHSPFAVPEEYWNRFKEKPIEMRGRDGADETVDITRCALAMCENIDWNVGRVLALLDRLELADNTIVIYFSDNGPNSFRWNGGMKGRKGSTDEGGVRSPMLVRWPEKIAPGTKVSQIAGAIDLLPTLTAMAGIERVGDKPLDGVDLSPLLLEGDENVEWPERGIFSHWGGRVSFRMSQYRFDHQGALFDMVADPGQTRNVVADDTRRAGLLAQIVKLWREEMLEESSDERPFPVGYREMPMAPLPARDGVPHGGVERSARAPNCSYFVNWTSKDDSMTWDIGVNATTDYEVVVYYTCPVKDAGSTVELEFQGSRLQAKVEPGWDPPLYTNQDTLPRPSAESQMKEFRPLRLGTMRLEAGRGPLTLRAVDIPGDSVMDVRMLTLTRLDAE
jgi:arylsulfatase A-like enzyme